MLSRLGRWMFCSKMGSPVAYCYLHITTCSQIKHCIKICALNWICQTLSSCIFRYVKLNYFFVVLILIHFNRSVNDVCGFIPMTLQTRGHYTTAACEQKITNFFPWLNSLQVPVQICYVRVKYVTSLYTILNTIPGIVASTYMSLIIHNGT